MRIRKGVSFSRRSIPFGIEKGAAPCFCLFLFGLTFGLQDTASAFAIQSVQRGQELYQTHCIECHGSQNQGVAGKFDHPISGPVSVEELASFVEQNMPEQDPDLVTGDDARAVAEFVASRFLTAGAVVARPRVELSHLTTTQYENSVADIFAHFSGVSHPEKTGGLTAEYRASRDFWKGDPDLERIDEKIRFDFGIASPIPDKIPAEEFSIVWKGAIFAPETGWYTFIVDTPNGFKLHVNNENSPLIDGWVSTPEAPRHTASIKLLGGRWYRVVMPFHKNKDPATSISLTWQTPGDVESEIPADYLSSEWVYPIYVVNTQFPPDDSSVGYPRGTLVSREWNQATTEAAVEVASYVHENFPRVLGTPSDSTVAEMRAKEFCENFAAIAFGGPLNDEEKSLYVRDMFRSATSPALGLKRSLMAILKSPRFLFPELVKPSNTGRTRANRLSLILTDTVPDSHLLQVAQKNELADRENVIREARRLLDQPIARAKIRQFFVQWLEIDDADRVSKDPEHFSGFDEFLVADLQKSLMVFVEECVWNESSDFQQLFLASHIWMNPRLRKFYGVVDSAIESEETKPDSPDLFEKMEMKPEERAGLLTHPLLLSKLAYYRSTSPIHRGVFVSRRLLGWQLKPPPVAVDPLGEDFDPEMTTRQRVEFQTSPDNCMSCHRTINPLGFTLERFDAAGRPRSTDNEKPVDTRVVYLSAAGLSVELNGPRDLANYLVGERETYRNFVESMFHHLVKQPVAAYGEDRIEELTTEFMNNECNIRELIVRIAADVAMFEIAEE